MGAQSPRGRWEVDRGPQELAYDFWWHLGYDVLLSSEWGTPSMVEGGVVPELLLGKKYGHRMHVWDLRRRRHLQALDLGDEHQMALETRGPHRHAGSDRRRLRRCILVEDAVPYFRNQPTRSASGK